MAAAARKRAKKKPPKATRHFGDIEQLLSEGPIPLNSIQKDSGKDKEHYNTLLSWTQEGITSRFTNGARVRLEHLYIGGVIKTTEAAYLRFLRRINGVKE